MARRRFKSARERRARARPFARMKGKGKPRKGKPGVIIVVKRPETTRREPVKRIHTERKVSVSAEASLPPLPIKIAAEVTQKQTEDKVVPESPEQRANPTRVRRKQSEERTLFVSRCVSLVDAGRGFFA